MNLKSNERSMQRLAFIDVSKALGIMLVVLGHNLGNGKVHDYIYSFHMPLFFIICGFSRKWTILGIKEFGREMFKCIERYVVPYFILMLIAGELSLHNIKNYIFVNRNITYMYPLLAKWFLPCFFISICLTLLLYQMVGRVKNRIAYTIMILLIAVVLITLGLYFDGARCGDEVLWLANIALMGCAFIYIGILLRLLYDKYRAAFKNYYSVILLMAAVVISVVSYNCNFTDGGYMAMVAGIYGTWYWFILSAVSGTVGVMIISVYLSVCGRGGVKPLRYIGQNSMVIMMFHSLFIGIGRRIFSGLLLAPLFETVFCIVICVLPVELVNRYVPSLAGRSQRNEKWFLLK